MRILLVHPHDLYHDPWTIRIVALARGLQARGHVVQLCHLPRRDRPAHAPLRTPLPDDPPLFELKPRQQHFFSNIRLMYRLARNVDLLHIQKCFAATALPILWTARLLNKPLHYDWDDDETAIAQIVEKRRFSRWQLAAYEKRLPHFASTVTYASQAIHERLQQAGFPEKRMWHLPVGADTIRFSPAHTSKEILTRWNLDPRKLTVLYIGQLEGAAHAHLLIQAAPSILAQQPHLQILIVGGGEQEASMRDIVAHSPAREAIFLSGYVEASLIPQVIGAADICIACFENHPATKAKSPLKIAEYLACGKPIVASRVGDVPWMIEGCGITVQPGSAQAIAEGILTYVFDPDRRRADGQKSRQRSLQYFTWERGVETLEQAYRFTMDTKFD